MKPAHLLLLLAAVACAAGSRGTPAESAGSPAALPATTTLPSTMPGVSDSAMRIYREAYVIDAHNDIFTSVLDDRYDPDVRHEAGFTGQDPMRGHSDLPRFLESGITAQFLSAWVDAPYAERTPDESYDRVLLYLSAINEWIARHPDRLIAATTAADVRRAKREGKVAMLIGVEGGHAIEGSIENLRELHRRGARYLTLTWNNGNQWAGASVGQGGTSTGGLTPFGREVVREMNRLGMLVDVSHVSEQTFFDAIAASSEPVIASHSSARALNDHPRNLTDEQLRAIARNGGVVNVNFFSRFIDPNYRVAVERMEDTLETLRDSLRSAGTDAGAIEATVRERRRGLFAALPRTPLSVLIDHFDHIAKVAGVDHVGIGSDFDGVSALPDGMEDVTRLPRIAQGLLDRGYSEADVKKVLGGNMMRVMEQALDRRVAPDR